MARYGLAQLGRNGTHRAHLAAHRLCRIMGRSTLAGPALRRQSKRTARHGRAWHHQPGLRATARLARWRRLFSLIGQPQRRRAQSARRRICWLRHRAAAMAGAKLAGTAAHARTGSHRCRHTFAQPQPPPAISLAAPWRRCLACTAYRRRRILKRRTLWHAHGRWAIYAHGTAPLCQTTLERTRPPARNARIPRHQPQPASPARAARHGHAPRSAPVFCQRRNHPARNGATPRQPARPHPRRHLEFRNQRRPRQHHP